MINIDKLYIYIYMYECVWYTWIRIHVDTVYTVPSLSPLRLWESVAGVLPLGSAGSRA